MKKPSNESLLVTAWLLMAIALVSIAWDIDRAADRSTDQAIQLSKERFEAIESMNRVQQRQLNNLMYPGAYNGVH